MARMLLRVFLGFVIFAAAGGVLCLPQSTVHAASVASLAQSSPAAQNSASVPLAHRLAVLEQQVAAARSSGDNAWMLVCCALVLLMTGPGLALFYGGLVRKKNVLGTMMQSFSLMAIVTVCWALFGYSLCFSPGNSFIGDFGFLFLRGVGAAPECRLRRHHSAADLHAVPVDVRHHHSGPDHRRLRRAHEIQRDGAVHDSLEPHRLLPAWRTWSGARAAC